MLSAIILICAATQAPHECGMDNARDILRTPVQTAMPLACLREGHAYLAGIQYPLRRDEYPRVVCTRPALPKNVG